MDFLVIQIDIWIGQVGPPTWVIVKQLENSTGFAPRIGPSPRADAPLLGRTNGPLSLIFQTLSVVIISVSLISIALFILTISVVLIHRKNLWVYKKISDTGNVGLTEEVSHRSFTYMELEKIANGFKEEIGKGASATVYKGAISNGQRIVAVKKLE